MENNKIGCRGGVDRTKIIDPNSVDGNLSSSNIYRQNEDLNISVKLTTYKKGRTVLVTEKEKGFTESTKTVSINFIEGSDINGKKFLTTKYTDLTTVFEEGTLNNETLGITNIDIDFNSSIVPQITIDFIDVRGSSIFQNEADISDSNTENPYSAFFQMPYPLFELEIKGYYGQPVTYCLHMIKFASKFNSQTGNFEIKCNFVGYTYAMLSDMLIGFLKAIPYTKIGKEKFKIYNSTRQQPLIDLVDLKLKIGNIATEIEKLAATSDNSKIINSFKEAEKLIGSMQQSINSFGSTVDTFQRKSDSVLFNFVLTDEVTTTQGSKDKDAATKKAYNEMSKSITESIASYNALNVSGLNINKDTFLPVNPYNNLTKKDLDQASETAIGNLSGDKLTSFKKDLLSDMANNYEKQVNDVLIFNAYDFRENFKTLEKQQTLIDDSIVDSNKTLANEIKDKISVVLGFNPTVRTMVEIFTALIEVFIETIYEVSQNATGNTERDAQLEKAFGNVLETTDLNRKDLQAKIYHPWPDYKEKDELRKTYVEKYLGSSNAIDKKEDIPELVFIDDLLNAFLTAAQKEAEVDALLANETINWIPSNIMDTRLFYSEAKEPYTRNPLISINDIKRNVLIRAMTFLGYTNSADFLTEDQIKAMAEIEAESMVAKIKDHKLLGAIKSITVDNMEDATGNINSIDRKIIKKDTANDLYYYNYILSGNSQSLKIIPFSSDFNGKSFNVANGTNDPQPGLLELQETGEVFLTNYSPAYFTAAPANNKFDDGGIYVKIYTPEEYETTATLVNTEITKESVFILENLKTDKISTAGFNPFGGVYGIQEYYKMDWGENGPTGLPLRYVFFQNEDKGNLPIGDMNGLAYTREKVGGQNPTTTIYDLNKIGDYVPLIKNRDKAYLSFSNMVHGSNISSNRFLFNDNGDDNGNSIVNNSDVSYPYIEQNWFRGIGYAYEKGFSLFGSKWYYLQDTAKCTLNGGGTIPCGKVVKSLLFLNTLPFNYGLNKMSEDGVGGPFAPKEIKHLFDINGGFVHAPRLWCAYVGGLFWWLSKENPEVENGLIVGGGRGTQDPIVWQKTCGAPNAVEMFVAPASDEYLPRQLKIKGNNVITNYIKITDLDVMKTLPEQVKTEFKRIFFEFVNGGTSYSNYGDLATSLEIWSGSSSNFCSFLTNTVYGNIVDEKLDKNILTGNLNNTGNYQIIAPIEEPSNSFSTQKDALFLELKDNSNAVKKIKAALVEEVIIGNTGYGIWRGSKDSKFGMEGNFLTFKHRPIRVTDSIYNKYFKAFTDRVAELTKDYSATNEEEKKLNQTFGNSNKNDIKLMLYRNCKNIYDKWLGGVTDPNNVIFQCGNDNGENSNRKTVDLAMARRYNYDRPRLIHSFRFVNRSFRDIGDELFIDPRPISGKINDFPNTSAYNVISSLLNENKFDFIALPTFINFYNDDVLESMFAPQNQFDKPIGSCGPSFVSVYTGQKSKNLDLKDNSTNYTNDGFDMRCVNGNLDPSIPDDFKEPLAKVAQNGETLSTPYEDTVPVFVVKYGQQNQNLFKDISLDQSEFSESEESIKIMQDISTNGAKNNPTLAGQNIFNVYSVRSYTAEVEMMGNAMIQPMMYFQLDNIPMFHGAYMITRVKHNIKPNNMSTNFTGIRIRAAETPIIDVADAYMELIETLDMTKAGNAKSGAVAGTLAPIVTTIIQNGGSNSYIDSNNIKAVKVDFNGIKGVTMQGVSDPRFLQEGLEPLKEMFKAWIVWMKDNNFVAGGDNGSYFYVTSLFRVNSYGSNHGWGIAVDIQMFTKDGKIIDIDNNVGSKPKDFDISYNQQIEWLYNNAYKYGFYLKGKDWKSKPEYWHWEYHGRAAACMWRKNPVVYKHTIKDIDDNKIKSFVKNPKGMDGKEAVYTSCESSIMFNGDSYEPKTGCTPLITKTKLSVGSTDIYNSLKTQTKLSDFAIAGIMGNLYSESNFVPEAFNSKGGGCGAYGLAQWRSDRQNKLLKYVTNKSLKINSYEGQLGFVFNELSNEWKYTLAALKNVTSAKDAATIFYQTYEMGNKGWSNFSVSSVLNMGAPNVRLNRADAFYEMIQTKNFYLPT